MPSGGEDSDHDSDSPLDIPEDGSGDELEEERGEVGQEGAATVGRLVRGRRDAPDTIDLTRMKTKEDIDADTTYNDILLFNQHEGARQRVHIAGMINRLMGEFEKTQRARAESNVRFDGPTLAAATVRQCKQYLNDTIRSGSMLAAYAIGQNQRRQHVVKAVCTKYSVLMDSPHENHAIARQV